MNLPKLVKRLVVTIAIPSILTGLGVLGKQSLAVSDFCIQIGSGNECKTTDPIKPVTVKPTYYPKYIEGIWSVVVKGSVGESTRIFAFNSNAFGSYWTPEKRARAIAERMNNYMIGKDYELVLGKINGYNTVCTGSNGECEHLIFTVKEGDEDLNAKIPALRYQLLNVSNSPLYESGCPQTINLNLASGTSDQRAKAVTSVCVSN